MRSLRYISDSGRGSADDWDFGTGVWPPRVPAESTSMDAVSVDNDEDAGIHDSNALFLGPSANSFEGHMRITMITTYLSRRLLQ